MTDGRITVKLEESGDEQIVTTRYKSDGSIGLVARLSADDKLLHIVTDEYEGAAMIDIEALPAIRRALARIARKLNASSRLDMTRRKDSR